MRRTLLAGNWKMHLDRARAVELARDCVSALDGGPAEIALCPTHVHLDAVGKALAGSGVALGAQDVYWEAQGAFTGEVSAPMLADLGCRYAIVGHSERRALFGEDDAAVSRKLRALLAAGIRPILCVGEQLAQRQAGQAESVVQRQLEAALHLVSAEGAAQVVVAYEPVWAIGTGVVATPEQAQAMHAFARSILAARYDRATALDLRILYGGSLKPDNAAALLSQPDIDGGLVGGASLDARSFSAIARAR